MGGIAAVFPAVVDDAKMAQVAVLLKASCERVVNPRRARVMRRSEGVRWQSDSWKMKMDCHNWTLINMDGIRLRKDPIKSFRLVSAYNQNYHL